MKAQDLKKSILQYAMQGKLVAQDPNDEPASELLKRIKAEKEQLIKDGKIKKEKSLPPITQDEIPYELPQGWEWVRFQDVVDVRDGTHDSPKYQKEGYPFITSKNLNNGYIDFENVNYISREDYLKLSQRSCVENEDILFAMIGSIGNPVIVQKDRDFSIKNVALFKKSQYLIIKYLYFYLYYIQDLLKSNATGAVQSFVSLSTLRLYLFALPPLAEQKRILEKLKEILPLVDEYGKNEEILSEMNQKLPKQIRQSILQYAVQGKLVVQNPKDEPASELLKHIKAEKDQLIKDGKIKKEKPLPPITQDEIPYDLPQGWQWVRMQEVYDVRDGTHDSPKNVTNGIPLITSKDFKNGKINFDNAKLISADDHQKIEQRSHVDDGDILYSMIGGNIGNMVIVKKERDFSIKNVALFKYYDKKLSEPYFLKLLLEAITFDFKNKAFGGAQQFVSLNFIRNYLIPLPPLAEQKRIVAKVEELLTLVNKLEIS